MRAIFTPPRRVLEATQQQIIASGASASSYGRDPIDGDVGWKRAGGRSLREVPYWTREKAVTASVAAYRTNPMARAILDTYTSFAVGDSGVTWQCTNPKVNEVVSEFWNDPRNMIGQRQALALRTQLLMGERLIEMLVGPSSGVVRYCPIDPVTISDVTLYKGNPEWPDSVILGNTPVGPDDIEQRTLKVVAVNDETNLREGQAMFWTPFKTLESDVRSTPFLMPVLDWLDNLDMIVSNLMDRTQLARYFVWDVEVDGGQDAVDNYVKSRGGLATPSSAAVEVHNASVRWKPMSVPTGAEEDSVASKQAGTLIAAGTGLARTWLADPEDSNRATSLTMAEPVRRRVGGIQKMWLEYQTELVRFAIDRAVAAKRIPAMVESTDARTGEVAEVPASMTVTVTGPEVAAADATITAQILLNLSTAVTGLTQGPQPLLSIEAAKVLVKKAWEGFAGVPYRAELDSAEANPDDIAQEVDAAQVTESPLLRLAR